MWTTIAILAAFVTNSQAFFFGGGGGAACGCAAPPACPPPPPPAPCGGGGGGGYAYSAPTAYAAPPPVYRPLPPPPPPQQYGQASYGSSYAQQPAPFLPQQPQPAFQSQVPQAQPIQYQPQPAGPIGGGGAGGKAGYAAPFKRHVREEYDTGVDQSEGYRVKRDDEAVFDPKCNSEDLKALILANINESTATSKRQIQSAAADALGGRIDVICSRGTFSYIVNTELYCETEKNGTTCFAFKQSS